MNKKQVAALLKVMSKDDTRPVLCSGYVDKFEDSVVLVVTDGYSLAAVKMNGADELVGKIIRRDAIERWYKLTDGKSRLTGEELVRVSSDDYAHHGEYFDNEGMTSGTTRYPEWQKLVPSGEQQPQEAMSFNAEYMKQVQDLDGSDGLTVALYGKLAPMVVRTNNGLYLVMPRKR